MPHEAPSELERHDEAAHWRAMVEAEPERPKLWRTLAAALHGAGDYDSAAAVWSECLARAAELEHRDPRAGQAFADGVASRLFAYLAELVQTAVPGDPDGVAGRWRLFRSIYSDPRFAELAARFPERFDGFVSLAGEDLVFKAAHKHGADMSPLVEDALALYASAAGGGALAQACRREISRLHGGLEEVAAKAASLLEDRRFSTPVVICGFHHSGTRLLAQLLARVGVFQRINLYQYEWSYVVQLNTILAPGCLDAARAGAALANEPGLVSPERLAFRMAMAGLAEGEAWGFKDPRNCLTAETWLQAFPDARVLHIVRDPVATLGTLPADYDRFVRLGEEHPTATRFWIDLWEEYVRRARRAMAVARRSAEVRFEDLCLDPAQTLRRAAGELELGLEVAPGLLKDVAVETGKADLRARLRSEGRLEAADLAELEALAAAYGYAGA
jgi:hypothetical protein